MGDEKSLELPTSPEVMIVSRGYGFTNRLGVVVDYAVLQKILRRFHFYFA